jgi:predicted phosphodiesterase
MGARIIVLLVRGSIIDSSSAQTSRGTLMAERTALIADVHGNTPALRAVLDDVAHTGCDRLFMLGDIVNGLDPAGCIDLLRQAWPRARAIKGNAEHYLLTPDLDAFPLRTQPMYAEVIDLVHWWRARLSEDQLRWLRDLPDVIRWRSACLVHDSPLDRLFPKQWHRPGIAPQYQELCYHARGLTPDIPADQLQPTVEWMDEQNVAAVYCGHTHVPFLQQIGTRRVCNVGSVGLPLDGDARAAWVLLEHTPEAIGTATIRRVPYAIDDILALVREVADYPRFTTPGRREAYGEMLRQGRYWRSFLTQP